MDDPTPELISEVTVQEVLRLQPGRHDLIVLKVKGPEYPPSQAYRTWCSYLAKALRERCGFDGVVIVQDQNSDLVISDRASMRELYTQLKSIFEDPTPLKSVVVLPSDSGTGSPTSAP